MNQSNLKPFKPGEQRTIENGKKGGLKKAENLREQKKVKEIIETILNMQPGEKETKQILSKYSELDTNEITYKTLIITKQIEKALAGDIKSATFIIELLGEYNTEIEHETKLPMFNIEVVDNRELEKIFEQYEQENA